MNIRVICEDFFKYLVPGEYSQPLSKSEALICLACAYALRAVFGIFLPSAWHLSSAQRFNICLFIYLSSWQRQRIQRSYVYFMLVAIIGSRAHTILVILFTYVTHVPPIRASCNHSLGRRIWNFIGNYFLSFEMHKKREKHCKNPANVQQ